MRFGQEETAGSEQTNREGFCEMRPSSCEWAPKMLDFNTVEGVTRPMKIASLFTGIGGLEAGLHRSGHTTLLTCEVWAPAVAVLEERFKDIEHHADVISLTTLPPETEVVTAGFPCQDLSQAGRTAGIQGQRSGLIEHVIRLIDSHHIPLVVLENVSFMLQLDRGAAMKWLTDAFTQRGYRWAYRTVNSLAFVPQRRERVFFVASKGDIDPADVLFVDEVTPPDITTPLDTHAHGFYWTEGTRGLGWADDAIPTLKNGSTVGIPSPPAILLPDGNIIRPDIRDAERLQGFPVNWTKPAETVGRSSMRWSLVGNAVTVDVATWLGKRLASPGSYADDLDMKESQIKERKSGSSWPKAARSVNGRVVPVAINAFPAWKGRKPLHQFLKYSGTPLSERATAGFLSRAEASSLRFVPGFLDHVRRHLMKMRNGTGPETDPVTALEAQSAAA